MTVLAAGGVVWRRTADATVEVLVVHRPKYDDWSLPKGKLRSREHRVDAALREVQEETGLRVRIGKELPSASYVDRNGNDKIVWYWAMEPLEGQFEPHDEVDEIRWVPFARLRQLLTYERDMEIADALPSVLPTAPMLLLLRHAQALPRSEWHGDDVDRPLTARGRRQAQALPDRLAAFPVDTIVSSPAERCTASVAHLAVARGLAVHTYDIIGENAGRAAVALLRDLAGTGALMCSHGDVIESVLEALVRTDHLDIGPDPQWAKGSVWVLQPEGDRFLHASYLPPPE